MIRSIVAVGAAVLVVASVSGATEQPPAPIDTALPSPVFGTVAAGPFSRASVRRRLVPLGPDAPPWAVRLYRNSVRVLVALTDPHSGALIAGERDGWDYVWPRDAAAGSIAFGAAGLQPEAARVAGFLDGVDLDGAARFHPDGTRVPGRPAAGDAPGWVAAANRAAHRSPSPWMDRQDYGENITGDLLANAIAAGDGRVTSRAASSRLGGWSARKGRGSSTPRPRGPPPSSRIRGSELRSEPRFSSSHVNRPPTGSHRSRAGRRERSGPRRRRGLPGRSSSSARPARRIACWLSCTGPKPRTGRCRSASTPTLAGPPRPRLSPGRMRSRFSPCALAIPERPRGRR